jgi:ElaB/YqjD/DUF883 family membrane-anchored ribosome-binding protein
MDEAMEDVKKTMLSTVDKVVKNYGPAAKELMDEVTDKLKKIGTVITNKKEGWKKTAEELVKEAEDRLVNAFDNVVDPRQKTALENLKEAFGHFADAIKNFVKGDQNKANEAFKKCKESCSKTVEAIKTNVEKFVNRISSEERGRS